ncbi:DUF6455 family protein [Roseovarius pelagicus]|uniref:DUF6455 family protein n=1 Tax=Roseovarius pelagicus TaxID=2980108 RepID=A0ABY6DDZ4_9RHOB|nr:DUF6455 family protein [Roseovarius pelagicus]UXX84374.1 DUF6455 family protein [Roseovarius pelagicus]
MTNPNTLKRHAALVDRMSQKLGIDLEEEMMRGQMQVDALGDAVLRCTGCVNADECDHWMDVHDDGAEQPPEYCRNAEVFAALKAGRPL